MFVRFQNAFLMLLPLLLAVFLQIQVSLFTTENYIGLRVNLADFLLPFCGLFVLASLLTKHSQWPNWKEKFGYWVLILPTLAFIIALVNGYFVIGEWSRWAYLNKFTGWIILLAYMGLGAWLHTNKIAPNFFKLFSITFIGFTALTLIYECLYRYMYWEQGVGLPFPGEYIEGFMFNRNAFAFLFICAVLVTAEYHFKGSKLNKIELAVCNLFWFLTPFAFLFNASRALWICTLPLLILLIIRYNTAFFKRAAPLLLIGAVILPFLFQNASNRAMRPILYMMVLFSNDPSTLDYDLVEGGVMEHYDSVRFIVLEDAKELIFEHPVTGAGLGTTLDTQQQKHGEILSVFDNTLLWILTEMGPFGLFSFVLLYIVMLHTLYKSSKETEEPFMPAVLYILLAFGLFSLFHEILYSRFMWFFLGLALSAPIAHRARQGREGH